ncbi:energy-coupling factor transporter transmembrane component T family protein [Corynebacterium terpenotabidum]|uniref:Uncharacterized protein n=1 Tax=Corynebacterium terpenotabidum Y-11 TaxID=1200352 RepID=S4XBN6_9CORY|nr:energy-coupling factor transporter transmembrane component T [Corynebacterium terpenotabidum]AGP29986.1 hypothetical protein A606_01655 [Corynebacterium terpenotabidum Y-11]
MNPLTPLTAAVCAVAVVMIAHQPVVSGGFLAASVVLAVVTGRRHRRALYAALILAVPATVSYALIYVPFADDGWATTGDLSLRFTAMTASGLVLLSFVDPDDLMRDLQLRIPAPLVYMVGSVVRLLPMAQQRWRTIRQVQTSRGVPDTWRARIDCVLPLVVGLVVDAGHRSRPLQRTGIGDAGPRTVLVPVVDSAAQRALRWTLVAVVVAVIVAGVVL